MKRRRENPNAELEALIRSQCYSCWEGCCCTLPRGRDGLHECVCGCPEKWTDEQERQFMQSMKDDAAHYQSHKGDPEEW